MNIDKSLRLNDDQYYKEETVKTHIVLHHTVGGSAKSTFEYWNLLPGKVATAYIIERDGLIYEVFDPKYWAHHLGMKHPKNVEYNKKTIGIELASEGSLRSGYELNQALGQKKFDEEWLYAFDIDVKPFRNAKKLYHGLDDKDKYMDCGLPFRGYLFYDMYDVPQVAACTELILSLCAQFSIKKQLIPNADKLEFDLSTIDPFEGIITHVNVRRDKTDLSPAFDWDLLEKALK